MDVLEPTLFDNHKDIINALFQIYFELSNLYMQRCYYDKQNNGGSSVKEKAEEKVREKYGLNK